MYRPIPLEEVIAAMPKKRQEAIATRGAELVEKVRRRMAHKSHLCLVKHNALCGIIIR